MDLNLSCNLDNAAFQDDPDELARVLATVAEMVTRGETDGNLRDVNGNAVGTWSVTP